MLIMALPGVNYGWINKHVIPIMDHYKVISLISLMFGRIPNQVNRLTC